MPALPAPVTAVLRGRCAVEEPLTAAARTGGALDRGAELAVVVSEPPDVPVTESAAAVGS